MSFETLEQLKTRRCVPCEGGVPRLSEESAKTMLELIPGWSLVEGCKRIRREWKSKNFMAAMEFFHRIAALAEAEGHHPDLHLVGYRNIAVELWTHAIDGLSENDFILAAKIDELPIALAKN